MFRADSDYSMQGTTGRSEGRGDAKAVEKRPHWLMLVDQRDPGDCPSLPIAVLRGTVTTGTDTNGVVWRARDEPGVAMISTRVDKCWKQA